MTLHLFSCWAVAAGHPTSARHELNWTTLRLELFGGRLGYLMSKPFLAQAHMHFLGLVFPMAASVLRNPAQPPDPIGELFEWAAATANRVDAEQLCHPR